MIIECIIHQDQCRSDENIILCVSLSYKLVHTCVSNSHIFRRLFDFIWTNFVSLIMGPITLTSLLLY